MQIFLRIEEKTEVYSRKILPSGESECIDVPAGLVSYAVTLYKNQDGSINTSENTAFHISDILKIEKLNQKNLTICSDIFYNQFKVSQTDCSTFHSILILY
ncbi:MAG: hypothetical protein IPK03_05410 [Bacteroidetes bacterium]|nr:hypothetical protein [Bacteroidota bacterium]